MIGTYACLCESVYEGMYTCMYACNRMFVCMYVCMYVPMSHAETFPQSDTLKGPAPQEIIALDWNPDRGERRSKVFSCPPGTLSVG